MQETSTKSNSHLNKISQTRYGLIIFAISSSLLVSALLRLVLWWQFGTSSEVPFYQLPIIISVGALNDLIELLYLLLPLGLYLWLIPKRLFQSKLHQAFIWLCCYGFLFFILYLAVVEFYYFQEYSARFNLVAVDYLIFPTEVLTNIWDSYPVVKALIAIGMITFILMLPLWPRIRQCFTQTVSAKHRFGVFAGHAMLLALVIIGVNSHSLDFSSNRVTNEITANGISSLFQAFNTHELNYNAYYRTDNQQAMFNTLIGDLKGGGGQFTALKQQRLNRHFPANPKGLGKLNVVVIAEESFGAEFNGSYGDKRGLTPVFDKLAKQGLLFRHTYATGTRTVRGLEAITTSFPPIPSEAIIRRPGNENIANWGQIMQKLGYNTYFLYGGYSYFDNMKYFYSHNGFTVKDRSNIKRVTFSNIWGVCDEDLMRYSAKLLDKLSQKKRPFFSIIMTTSNHKPYTYPKGIPGVSPQFGGRQSGIRYADYSIGKFFEYAKKQPWFKNTLFVIVADHGARVYGSAEIPVYSYEIPLLILAPGRITPKTINTTTSQIDIAPTVLGLLGLAYEAPFYGQNILTWPKDLPRSILFNHDHDAALAQGNKFAVLGLLDKAKTYHYDTKTRKFIPIKQDQRLINLATAYYQIAYEQFKQHRYTL